MTLYMGVYVYAIIVHTWANQVLPKRLIEHFDTLPFQYRHIVHMHVGVLFEKIHFWKNNSFENLDNFSLIQFFVYA